VIRLGDLVTLQGGGTPSRSESTFWNGDVPWASVKDISSSRLTHTMESISSAGVRASATNVVPAGNVVVATRMAVGRASILEIDAAINQDLKALIPRAHAKVHPPYLIHLLTASTKYLESRATGATVQGIRAEVLEELPVPHPVYADQVRIADILDKADAIRGKRKEAIALTEELLRSTFLEMFGDPMTNPKGWPVRLLGRLGDLDRGRSRHRPRNDPALLGGRYPLIQTGEVANCDGVIRSYEQTYSEFGLDQSKMWPAGTLCITIAANIAKTGILAFDACFPDSVVGFTPKPDVTTEYLQYWMSFLQPILERQAPQVAQKNINLEILRALGAPTPPPDRQRTFSRFVTEVRRTRTRMHSSFESADRLFSSLIAHAFSSQLNAMEGVCCPPSKSRTSRASPPDSTSTSRR